MLMALQRVVCVSASLLVPPLPLTKLVLQLMQLVQLVQLVLKLVQLMRPVVRLSLEWSASAFRGGAAQGRDGDRRRRDQIQGGGVRAQGGADRRDHGRRVEVVRQVHRRA